jgi:hypothetical protein
VVKLVLPFVGHVAVANVTGIGNIATINLTGSTSNVLYGNGVFVLQVVAQIQAM